MPKKKLFALLIGINKYAVSKGFKTLHGAEADAQNLQDYLFELSSDFEVQTELLLGKNATRANIIAGISQHLGQAESDDIALLFFAGHGLKEDAPAVFKKTDDDATVIEALACYDSYSKPGIHGLANKEIRYLLKQMSAHNPHLAVITDCCHAAKLTRSGLQPLARLASPRNGQDRAPARNWQEFIFGNTISEAQVRQAQMLNDVLPEAVHIHLAACQAGESAFEVGQEGVFTAHLLEALRQSNGAISYAQLNNNLIALIRSRAKTYAQQPSVYATPQSSLEDAPFLLASGRRRKIYAALAIGASDIRVNRGLIHGVPANEELWENISISIFDKTGQDQTQVASGIIVATDLSSSKILLFPPDVVLQQDRVYQGQIEGLYLFNFNVALWGLPADEKGKALVRDAYLLAFEKEIQAEPNATTDVVVLVHEEQMVLAHPDSDYGDFDGSKFVPLVEQLYGYTAFTTQTLMTQLKCFAQWNFVRNIQNPDTRIVAEYVDFTISYSFEPNATTEKIFSQKGCYHIPAASSEDKDGTPADIGAYLWFKLENKSPDILYVNLVYLSSLFGIHIDQFSENGNAIAIEPNKEYKIDKLNFFGVEKFITTYNQIAENGIFRLFVAKQDFNVKDLAQTPLPPPEKVSEKKRPKGAAKQASLHPIQFEIGRLDWAVFDYPVRLLNPDYK